jgi:hypothetical protein
MIADGGFFASVLLFLGREKEDFAPYGGEYC